MVQHSRAPVCGFKSHHSSEIQLWASAVLGHYIAKNSMRPNFEEEE